MGADMNTVTTDDRIEVTVELKAPLAKVWEAVATEDGMKAWFAHMVGGFEAGRRTDLVFYGETGVYPCGVEVVAVEPMSRMAYRWHPGGDVPLDAYPEEETTLVEFLLEETAEGTRLRVVETGFARIPEERRAKCFELNTEGWNSELAKLSGVLGIS